MSRIGRINLPQAGHAFRSDPLPGKSTAKGVFKFSTLFERELESERPRFSCCKSEVRSQYHVNEQADGWVLTKMIEVGTIPTIIGITNDRKHSVVGYIRTNSNQPHSSRIIVEQMRTYITNKLSNEHSAHRRRKQASTLNNSFDNAPISPRIA